MGIANIVILVYDMGYDMLKWLLIAYNSISDVKFTGDIAESKEKALEIAKRREVQIDFKR